MNFSESLKKLRRQKGLTQEDLAEKMGMAKSSISMYETGNRKPSFEALEAFADFFNVNMNVLTGDKKEKGIKIPILGRVVAGIPIEAITDIDGYEEITPKLAATGSFFALHIKGDSMAPYMLPNDIVIVRCQEDVDCGDIAIILVNGDEATVKKVQKSKEGITLIGMNPSVYAPHFYTNQEILELPVKVIGKVVEIRRPLP